MDIREFLKDNIVVLDGGMGTLLQKAGLRPGEEPELWNLTHADVVEGIQRDYFSAGSNVVNANTFGANTLKFEKEKLEEIVKAAIETAKRAKESSEGDHAKFVALDIGPTGKMLKPYGDLEFEDAVAVFAETVRLGALYGADLVMIETMNDSYETKAALLAVRENCDLPVFVSNAYGEDGKLMTGATPAAMVAMLEGMGADAIGANCSLGPEKLMGVVDELLANASVPVLLKPNAGLPQSDGEKTYYDIGADDFAREVALAVKKGVRVAGGCCGTTPECIGALSREICGFTPVPLTKKNITCVSSYTHAVKFGESPVLIGERINPTGKKRFKEALRAGDIEYILGEGIAQEEKGAHVLDVNVGLPEIDEKAMLTTAVRELQAVTSLPLQIDTADADAMEAALRLYNGKAMVNSVNGKEESMRSVFPLVKKYGGLVVALTLDERGIPATAEERFEIAKKIISTAAEYGIEKKDLVFDTLAMTVSADKNAALATLGALHEIKEELGCHTSLGVSNVSFGLPVRDAVNSTFFALALERGLSAAIMNPYSAEMMKTYYAFRALHGLDENCADYISFASSMPVPEAATPAPAAKASCENGKTELQNAIIKGLREKAATLTKQLLETNEPLDIVQREIIPSLDIIGKGFEEKTVYLPGLLISAEAAKYAFEEIKSFVTEKGGESVKKCDFVLATVRGDVHDIGKNIVKLLLENYGFNVIDLGKDVPPEAVAEAAERTDAPFVGLSALMTTTVPAMEETIKLLRVRAPYAKIIVGGAVLTQEYADRIGADKYAADAMETVRYADSVWENA
jgi:5-methyltetrahydrofolate--homocysteine methyltransferase